MKRKGIVAALLFVMAVIPSVEVCADVVGIKPNDYSLWLRRNGYWFATNARGKEYDTHCLTHYRSARLGPEPAYWHIRHAPIPRKDAPQEVLDEFREFKDRVEINDRSFGFAFSTPGKKFPTLYQLFAVRNGFARPGEVEVHIGDFNKLTFYLRRGRDPNEQDHNGNTFFFSFLRSLNRCGDDTAVLAAKVMIEHGANVNTTNRLGEAALDAIIVPDRKSDLRGSRPRFNERWNRQLTAVGLSVLRLLLEHGADVSQSERNGSLLERFLRQCSNYEVADVDLLVRHGASITDDAIDEASGETRKYLLDKSGQTEERFSARRVSLFNLFGTEPNFGDTNNLQKLRFCLEAGCDPEGYGPTQEDGRSEGFHRGSPLSRFRYDLHFHDDFKPTFLAVVAAMCGSDDESIRKGSVSAFALLLEYKADPRGKKFLSQDERRHHLARWGSGSLLHKLATADFHGPSAFRGEFRYRNIPDDTRLALVELLLNHGAKTDDHLIGEVLRSGDHNPRGYEACRKMVEFLVGKGARVNRIDICLCWEDQKLRRYLLEKAGLSETDFSVEETEAKTTVRPKGSEHEFVSWSKKEGGKSPLRETRDIRKGRLGDDVGKEREARMMEHMTPKIRERDMKYREKASNPQEEIEAPRQNEVSK